MYLTYDEYQEYGGKIESEEEYDRLEFKARSRIDTATFNRLVNENPVRESVKRLMYEMVNTIEISETATEQGMAGTVTSVKNDGLSINYANGEAAGTGLDRLCKGLLREYLLHEFSNLGVPLLYRGLN